MNIIRGNSNYLKNRIYETNETVGKYGVNVMEKNKQRKWPTKHPITCAHIEFEN